MLSLKKVCGAVSAGLVSGGLGAGFAAAAVGITRDAMGDNADAARPEWWAVGIGGAAGFVIGFASYFCCGCSSMTMTCDLGRGNQATQPEAVITMGNALMNVNPDTMKPTSPLMLATEEGGFGPGIGNKQL